MRGSIKLAIAAITATIALGPRPAAGRATTKRRIEVQGHRGARALRPENTLAAFDYALSVGVDVLELDVGVTADDRVVVLHDQRVNPVLCRREGRGGGKPPQAALAVRALTLAQLHAYDCGRITNPRFPRQQRVAGARIPTLDQVLALVGRSRHPAARRARLNIETKIVPGRPALSPSPRRFVALVVAVLSKHKMLGRCTLQSFDHRTLLEAARQAPRLARVALVGKDRPDLVAVARAARAKTVSPHQLWITAADVRRAHRAGLRVVPWTANRPEEWDRLIRFGVDGIITDDPAALIRHLEQRNLR